MKRKPHQLFLHFINTAAECRQNSCARFVLISAIACLALVSCGDDSDSTPKSRVEQMINASRVCSAFMDTDLIISCEITRSELSVDVQINTSAGEARKMCRFVPGMVSAYTSTLERRWRLRIFPPFDSESPLAVCSF